ncbi:hypothetical protein JTE90_010322 [Oedothorax gibbosus]|uniref:Uncharacterized protein n=1 Tax=Oedothorax gibbosus TaxID=931172 RepID=A0AAV6V3C5_9ARAC|nr:hypothetical protein JTE90_010322 [Oedothorax gibbosus]
MVNNQVPWSSGKTLGGSSVINAMMSTRGNRKNYDDWAKQGCIGWSYSDVKPYFLKAEDNQEPDYIADGYHVVGGPLTVAKQKYHSETFNPIYEAATEMGYKFEDPDGRHEAGFYDTLTTMRRGQRCSAAKAYLVPAENRTNLDIITNAFVRKIEIEDGRAQGVEFDHGGETYTVKAKREVILSAGTVNSAQLLMLSGIGPKEHLEEFDIPVKLDLPVGENFQEQCGPSLFFELDPEIPNRNEKLENKANVEEYINNRMGVLAGVGASLLATLSSKYTTLYHPDYHIIFVERTAPREEFSIEMTADVIRKYFGPYRNSTLWSCYVQHLRPKSRGTVKLQSANPFDAPLIDPNYLAEPEDILPIVEGFKTCKAIGTSEPLKKIGSKLLEGPFPGCEDSYGDDDKYYECIARSFISTLNNQVGTVKMGHPSDPTTVVTPRLKVKGIDGLRVVDASIMPTIPSINANLPVIMIAEKASDMIKETIDCPTQLAV